jgi:serine/threonine-protein phosphatase 2A regulatory subunit B''
MAAAIKMDELLVSWLGSDTVYENVQNLMDSYRAAEAAKHAPPTPPSPSRKSSDEDTESSPRGVIPPFYPKSDAPRARRRRRMLSMASSPLDTWLPEEGSGACVRDQVEAIFAELGQEPPVLSPSSAASEEDMQVDPKRKYLTLENFGRITKKVCRFPSFFNGPLFQRILDLWNARDESVASMDVVTMDMFEWFWLQEMESYDAPERFFRLMKQPEHDYIARDDFLPYIKELLNDHPVSDAFL